ncbi:MAG: histidinol dehydrogenase [Pseudomonadota bacterium]
MPSDPRLLNLGYLSAHERAQLLRRAESDIAQQLQAVAPIVSDVAQRGDAALCDYAAKFDNAQLRPDQIKASASNFSGAEGRLDPDLKVSMQFAADAIRRFHETQMPEPMWMKEMAPGVLAGERWTALRSVACYVPRGKGAFPSVALMTTIPAMVANVGTIAVLTPPAPDGRVDDATLYACRLAGIEHVYKAGGAVAVAAAAYGTETVPRCDKIVGPGSTWFMAAKRLLVEHIDPGSPAGPSECIVLADGAADPRKVALDVLNEAEHGDDSSVYLVTESQALATAVISEIRYLWMLMGEERVGYSSAVLSGGYGGILIAPDRATACAFVNDYAPEHLMIHATDPWSYLGDIQHAGEILLGENSSISIANFVLGPNHVLPTSGRAHTASPLSVFDYLKRQTIGHLSEDGYRRLAHHAHRFATYEGFDAHANAVSVLRDGESPEVPAANLAQTVLEEKGDGAPETAEPTPSDGLDAALADMAADMRHQSSDDGEPDTTAGAANVPAVESPVAEQSAAASTEVGMPELRVEPQIDQPELVMNDTAADETGVRVEPSLLPEPLPNAAQSMDPGEQQDQQTVAPHVMAEHVHGPGGDFADPASDPFSVGGHPVETVQTPPNPAAETAAGDQLAEQDQSAEANAEPEAPQRAQSGVGPS